MDYLLMILPALLALVAVAAVIWCRREARKDRGDQPGQQAQRPIWRPGNRRDDR